VEPDLFELGYSGVVLHLGALLVEARRRELAKVEVEVVFVGEAAFGEGEPGSNGEVGLDCEFKEPLVVTACCTERGNGPVELLESATCTERRASSENIASSFV
jgi:hypothetical protein